MKRPIKKWIFRVAVAGSFMAALLLCIILNPVLTYANKTAHNSFTIFHDKALDPSLATELDEANELLKVSEFYNPKLRLDICLNDGSMYPTLMQKIRGRAFAWGFYNKVILQGDADYKNNYVSLNGYNWNLTQLLAHEMTHCLQFDKLGLWKSKPIANIANWKWEGYAEYVSRQSADQKDLAENIKRLLNTNQERWEIIFNDNTISPREYYNYWLLVQYCIDIKKMSYEQVLADTAKEDEVRIEMMNWYTKYLKS